MNKNARRSLVNFLKLTAEDMYWIKAGREIQARRDKEKVTPTLKSCSHEDVLYSASSRKLVIDALIEHLTPHADKFDAIAISGYSMSMIAPIIAMLMGKNLILVRKGEACASGHTIEGTTHQRYIIIDDLVSSGDTFRRIIQACEGFYCQFVGYALFKQHDTPSFTINYLKGELGFKENPICFMCKMISIQE